MEFKQLVRNNVSYFRKRAIFKKTSIRDDGNVVLPKDEALAIGARLGSRLEGVVVPLTGKEPVTFRGVDVNQMRTEDGRSFNFTIPKKEMPDAVSRSELSPAQFIVSKDNAGIDIGRRVKNTANSLIGKQGENAAMWKARLRRTPNDDLSVRVDPNERDYFNITEDSNLEMAIIPLEERVLRTLNKSKTTIMRSVIKDEFNPINTNEQALRVNIPESMLPYSDLEVDDTVQIVAKVN